MRPLDFSRRPALELLPPASRLMHGRRHGRVPHKFHTHEHEFALQFAGSLTCRSLGAPDFLSQPCLVTLGGSPLPGTRREADSRFRFARRRNDNNQVRLIASQQVPVML